MRSERRGFFFNDKSRYLYKKKDEENKYIMQGSKMEMIERYVAVEFELAVVEKDGSRFSSRSATPARLFT